MRIIILLIYLFFGNSLLFAQTQIVHECAEILSTKDAFLHEAIKKSLSSSNLFDYQTEDYPCAHQQYIFDAFKQTFNQEIFKHATAYSFSLLKTGDDLFSIERFVFKNKHDADVVGNIIRQRKINNLQIESLTYYDFFLNENNLFFFIADRQSFNKNQPIFKIIKDNFLLEMQKITR